MILLFQRSFIHQTLLSLLKSHIPSSGSLKQLIHYGQLIKSDRFCQFDYGATTNKQIYGHWQPPDYNLKASSAPVAIFYSDGDIFVHPLDAMRTRAELKNVVQFHRVDSETFNHYDFVVGTDVNSLLYDYVIELVREMDTAVLRTAA